MALRQIDKLALGQTGGAHTLLALLAFLRDSNAAALFADIINEFPPFPVTADEQRR